ncbi:hypothetical protein CAAN1_17S01046 [[Candida] anglica]|uniref:Peptidase A1 domain-containing protein n=1 Tax=[Candida] anglica TaxID=148631 RepID=A0ABP0E8T9_9ASCO
MLVAPYLRLLALAVCVAAETTTTTTAKTPAAVEPAVSSEVTPDSSQTTTLSLVSNTLPPPPRTATTAATATSPKGGDVPPGATTSTSTTDPRVVVTIGRATSSGNGPSDYAHSTSSISSFITEDYADQAVLKAILTKDADSGTYYNARVYAGNQSVDLRVDIVQPDLWVMNGNDVLNCSYYFEEIDSLTSQYGASYFATQTTSGIATESACAQGGVYSTASDQPFPDPKPSGIYNGERYDLPYVDEISASGVFVTDNISFVSSRNFAFTFPNFTFVDVNDTSMSFGGLGLAGNPTGSGFLDTLHQSGLITSPAYSLWFYNSTSPDRAVGELLLGTVNTKYVDGDFQQFDMLPHTGPKFSGSRAELIDRLKLPIIALSDLSVENSANGNSISIISDGNPIPVVLDSRASFSQLPSDVLVNLAIQTNAYYNVDINRWIVGCSAIEAANALLDFKVGDLMLKIPLNNFLVPAFVGTTPLNFSDGSSACFLAFLPSTAQGFSSLGLPFLSAIYLAVDNASGKIALGAVDQHVSINIDDFNTASPSSIPVSYYLPRYNSSDTSSTSLVGSIEYMTGGDIPFATPYTPSVNLTLTYDVPSSISALGDNIPARFSGVTIKSGEIYITQGQPTTGFFPGLASAASASSSTSKASAAHAVPPPFDASPLRPLRALQWAIPIVSVLFATLMI